MSERLPQGWAVFSLSNITKLQGGKTPSKANPSFWNDGSVCWASPKDMKSVILKNTKDKISDAAVDDGLKLFPKGSILFVVRSGILQHSFPVAIAELPTTVNQDLKVIEPIGNIVPHYIAYMLRAYSQRILDDCSKAGTTVNSIETAKLEAYGFPLAPLPEQTRIAQKLDQLIAQVDTLKARVDAIPNILKRFRQSVLAAAVSGKLTEAWRGENDCSAHAIIEEIKDSRIKLWVETELNKYQEKGKQPPKNLESKYKLPKCNKTLDGIPSSWGCLSWEEISMWITYGFTKPMPHVDKGPLIITAKNVRHSEISLKGAHRTTDEAYQSLRPKDKPSNGDILIVKDGATTGRASLAPVGISEYCISQSVAVVWLKYSPMERNYLLWCVQCKRTQSRIQEVLAGMAMPHLSITDFGKMLVPIPPKEEQKEIVRRVEQLFTFADQIEAKVATAQKQINHLTQSILAKAFRGELVPQDPNDEPASELLARIQQQREATAALSKATKRLSQTKKKSKPKKPKPELKQEPNTTKKPLAVLEEKNKPQALPETQSKVSPAIHDKSPQQWTLLIRNSFKKSTAWISQSELISQLVDALEMSALEINPQHLNPEQEEQFKKAIKTACQWQLLIKEGREYRLRENQFADYENDALDSVLAKVLRKGKSIERDALYKMMLEGLGFKRKSVKAEERFKRYVNSAIRRKVLQRVDGELRRG